MHTHHNDENVCKCNIEAYCADIGYEKDAWPIAPAAFELLKCCYPQPLRVSAINRNDINVVMRQYLYSCQVTVCAPLRPITHHLDKVEGRCKIRVYDNFIWGGRFERLLRLLRLTR